MADENIYYNYDDSEPASVEFHLSNGNTLLLFFGNGKSCKLIPKSNKSCRTPSDFRNQFNCSIGFAPILGPVDQNEPLFDKEAARRALFGYTASRNFRNIWHHYPARFEEFRSILSQTWPGMDIEQPKVDFTYDKPRLHMFCPENRFPREICWAGFGFQVWCQMLTHLVQSNERSLFLIRRARYLLAFRSSTSVIGSSKKSWTGYCDSNSFNRNHYRSRSGRNSYCYKSASVQLA